MHCPLCDDITTWKCFLHYWQFVRGFHWLYIDFPHNGPLMQNFIVFDVGWKKFKQVVEQTVKLLLISDAIMLIWHHSNGDNLLCHFDIHPSLSFWQHPLITQVSLPFTMRITWQSCQLCRVLEWPHQNLYKHNTINLIIDESSFYLIKTIPWSSPARFKHMKHYVFYHQER